jgi:hypothetical protein
MKILFWRGHPWDMAQHSNSDGLYEVDHYWKIYVFPDSGSTNNQGQEKEEK